MITLSTDQQKAAAEFMNFMVDDTQQHMIIRGHAGCGKSTLTKHILGMIDKQMRLMSLIVGKTQKNDLDIYLTAPTNKAAKVLEELTGREASTIQSLLGLRVTNDYKTGKTGLQKTKEYKLFANSLIIVDEASFIDPFLLAAIVEATKSCKVLFIGDPYQLAPPKEKNLPVFDLPITVSTLTTINRNAGPIAELAGKYRDAVSTGIFPTIQEVSGKIERVDGPGLQALIDVEFKRPDRGDNDAKILAWTNGKVHQYNTYVRKDIHGYGDALHVDERVVTNNPIMSNGRMAYSTDQLVTITDSYPKQTSGDEIAGHWVELDNYITRFLPDNQAEVKQHLKWLAAHKNWAAYFDVKDTWLDLRPIHSCTIHKSQGSTYDTVFIDLNDIGRCTSFTDAARMLYVAISRASNKVILYGELPPRFYKGTL